MAIGPSTVFSCGFTASTYMKAQKGNKLKAAIAQNGTFFRVLAATT
jgi:hypothetical protein